LREQHALVLPELELVRERSPIAVVKPARESLGCCKEIHVAGDDPRVDEIVRLLDFRIVKTRLFETRGVLQLVDVDHEDELDRRVRRDGGLVGTERQCSNVFTEYGSELVAPRFEAIRALLQNNVHVDLLRVARRGRRDA
jgi:hypothetical protein